MDNPDALQTEVDVLEEKIEALEHLLKGKKRAKSDMDNYLVRKLAQYREERGKLARNLSDLTGVEPPDNVALNA
jgi:hypothetical protein